MAVLLVALAPTVALAQSTGIAGVVKDTSGAVLPGVTVEASSPALIERVRTVTTDSQGQYKILDLRPGTYVVTFTLTGFSAVKRDGIELLAQFTATVNAEMRVGAVEETITVSGASPIVDTQNVIKHTVIEKETIDAMPTSKNWSTIGVMTIGVSSNQSDVGGSAGEHQNQLKAHGGSFNDRLVQLDGLMIANMACNYSCVGISTNDASTQELSYEFGAISAETSGGGVRVNIIPKEGGNRYSGSLFGNYANHSLQANNVTEALKAQGVLTADSIRRIDDFSGAFGGPLMKDKLWFWSAHRFWGYEQVRTNTFYEKTPGDLIFDPDPSKPGTETQKNQSNDLRLTWQISAKNKISAYYNIAPRQTEHWTLGSTIQPDAAQLQNLPLNHFETVTFRSTISTKLLAEAAGGNLSETWTREPSNDSLTSKGYPVTDLDTGINFRAYSATFSRNFTSLRSYRGSLSYVPGSQAIKVGFTLQQGPAVTDVYTSYDTSLQVRSGKPAQVTVRTTPYTTREDLVADLGLYLQDTWTIKRVTANLGVRWDYLNNKVEAQDAPGGTWIGPRHYDGLSNVPNYKDISPRLGVAYDVFGNGKTAAKATLSKYMATSTVGTARLLNPINTSVNTATRSWTDRNVLGQDCYGTGANLPTTQSGCDNIPEVSELGPLASTFGQINTATTYDPETISGWGKRRMNWEFSTGITQELMSRVSAEIAFDRRAQGNFTTTDNLKLTPDDYDTYCITVPSDSRLPNAGTQLCGLPELKAAKFGPAFADKNVVTFVDKLGGKQTEVFTGVDISVNARLGNNLFVTGGVASGNTKFNYCDGFVDNPKTGFGLEATAVLPPAASSTGTVITYCNYDTSWLTQAKATGSYSLPWQGIQVGAVMQNLPGQMILANWNIGSADALPSLGRALNGGTARTVPLIKPGTMYTPRRTQVDLRLSKNFRMAGTKRLQVMADIFNLTNSNAAVGATSNAGEPPAAINTTFAPNNPAWLRPLNILQARYLKFGAQFNF